MAVTVSHSIRLILLAFVTPILALSFPLDSLGFSTLYSIRTISKVQRNGCLRPLNIRTAKCIQIKQLRVYHFISIS